MFKKIIEFLFKKETTVVNTFTVREEDNELMDMQSIKTTKRFGAIVHKHTGIEQYNFPTARKKAGVGFKK